MRITQAVNELTALLRKAKIESGPAQSHLAGFLRPLQGIIPFSPDLRVIVQNDAQ